MKHFYTTALVTIFFTAAQSQINTGGLHANFGVDADTKASFKNYGPAVSFANSDDWFALTGAFGQGVIDTTNASYYKSLLQNNKNISFNQGMSKPEYSNVNGRLWLDAVYARDYAKYGGKDSTCFTSGKNGDNPASWTGGIRTLDPDNDIVDAYAHLRRNGSNATDSLWLFGAVSTMGNATDRYVDIELYNKAVSYNKSTGRFNTGGALTGHTQWLFDASGKVIQTGDVLITIVYVAGQEPQVDVHIWVSKLIPLITSPSLFKFGSTFHAASSSALYGYANILPKSSNTVTGSAITNYTYNASADTTYSTPWGTMKSTGAWSANYSSKQFGEIGLNLTRIGIDPASYPATSALVCSNFYQSVLFKSGIYGDGYDSYGSSGSGGCGDHTEYVNLEDFVGPFNFTTPVLDYTISTDTLTCSKPVGTLSIQNQTCAVGVHTWSTIDGNITATNANNSSISVKKSGSYRLASALANGCPSAKVSNVFVVADSVKPVASADITMNDAGELQLLGGDVTLSALPCVFGASKGLSWDWRGPNGFSSSIQNPIVTGDWVWGSYYLTVTENRNGCTATAMLDISFTNVKKVQQELIVDNATKGTYLSNTANGSQLTLVTNQDNAVKGRVAIYTSAGQLLGTKEVQLVKGQNNIQLPLQKSNQVRIVSLYVGTKAAFTKRIIF
jgi:hypothetical protein